MIRKKSKPPLTRRTFASPWGELDYLCAKVRYWLYVRKERARAERYLERLERVLDGLPENDLAIIRQEALSLMCGLKGDVDKAIAHRKREIELMERLQKEARSRVYTDSTREYLLRDRGAAALQERREIVRTLLNSRARLRDGMITGSR